MLVACTRVLDAGLATMDLMPGGVLISDDRDDEYKTQNDRVELGV
jgi:hypothetical protein